MDESCEHSSHSLNTQGKWGDIEKKHVLDITCKHSSLYGSSDGYSLVRVDSLVWRLSEEFLDLFLDLWHSCHTSDKQDLINLVLGEA